MTKREIQIQAETFLKQGSNKDAFEICEQLWKEFPQDTPDNFNLYDAILTLKATKNHYEADFDFVYQIANIYKENELVRNFFSWYVFYKSIKGATGQEIIQRENIILKLLQTVPQKRMDENSTFPCPVTISILNLIKAHSKGMFNANKVNEWLGQLNPTYLSRKVNIIPNTEKGDKEDSSDLEKFYGYKTKALLKLERYKECMELCAQALEDLKSFHYDNSLWFKMRIALCHEKLGNLDESESLFQELLSTKAGSDKWFLYSDLAEIYFEQGQFEEAWKYAVDAAFYGFDLDKMNNLFYLQAKILFKLGRTEEGKILAQLIAAVLKKEGYKVKQDYDKLFKFYSIDSDGDLDVKTIHRTAQKFWIAERYSGKTIQKGTIVFIHRNDKNGKIKTSDGNTFDFHKRDFQKRLRNLEELKEAEVSFVIMNSFNGKKVAENITILAKKELPKNDLTGKILLGTVKNVAEFGIFVKLNGFGDGLIHKSKLSKAQQDSFESDFIPNQEINVEVIDVTEKGIKLKLVTS